MYKSVDNRKNYIIHDKSARVNVKVERVSAFTSTCSIHKCLSFIYSRKIYVLMNGKFK